MKNARWRKGHGGGADPEALHGSKERLRGAVREPGIRRVDAGQRGSVLDGQKVSVKVDAGR
jgi:hypothetical protein